MFRATFLAILVAPALCGADPFGVCTLDSGYIFNSSALTGNWNIVYGPQELRDGIVRHLEFHSVTPQDVEALKKVYLNSSINWEKVKYFMKVPQTMVQIPLDSYNENGFFKGTEGDAPQVQIKELGEYMMIKYCVHGNFLLLHKDSPPRAEIEKVVTDNGIVGVLIN